MAGQASTTPLPKKLGIDEGSRVSVLNAPEGFLERIGVTGEGIPPLDVIVLFTTRRDELDQQFAALARWLAPAGGLWVAWPKKGAPVASDLSFEAVQEVGLAAGLVDNKSCAVDDTWQAVRFVRRREDR